jgi:predicted enzyme related to lactoylglutathione lyase
MVIGIDTHVYTVKDFDRALAFYTGLIGHAPATSVAGGWAEWELADGSAFAIGKHPNFPFQVGNTVMFAVPDIDEAIALVTTLGGKAEPPGESPVCNMSFGEDTEGNEIVLHRRKS